MATLSLFDSVKETTRECINCSQFFPVIDFPRANNQPDKHGYICGGYSSALSQRQKSNLYRKVAYSRNRRPCNSHYQQRYGMSRVEYDAMLAAQKGVCAICKQPESKTRNEKTYELAVDHCHSTGQVRELLCSRCNLLLGATDDNPDILQAMLDYLQKHEK